MFRKISQYAWLTTFFSLLAGFALVYFDFVGYGASFFVIFPVGIGFAIAIRIPDAGSYALQMFYTLLGLLAALALAVALKFEGFICVFLALPIFLFLVLLGFLLAILCKRTFLSKYAERDNNTYVVFIPLLLLLLFNFVEKLFSGEPHTISVTTSVQLPYSATDVFDGIKSMDTLNADKPLLLKMGLPAPNKCILEDNKVGAKRTCLFDNGKIVAEITDYHPDSLLQMKVIEYTLTGSKWFSFKDAWYTFERIGTETKITRTTTYTSVLKPRIYWEPIEKYGIAQEHLYVLKSLEKNLVAGK